MNRTEPAHERLHDTKKQQKAKMEALKNQLQEREMESIKQAPEINTLSKHMNRSLEQMYQWDKEKHDKLKKAEEDRKQSERLHIHKPKINPKSERLAQTMERGPVEERLFNKAFEIQKKRIEKAREMEEKQLEEMTPLISVHSANLQRDQKIYDRLYNVSVEQERKKKNVAEVQDHLIKHRIDPNTGSKMYSPHINVKSAKLQRAEPVEEILYRKASEKEKKRQERLDQEMKELEGKKQSKVNAYSELLVKLLEQRTQVSSKDRLLGSGANAKSNESMNTSITFKPVINEKSREIDHGSSPHVPRFETLIHKGSEYQTKRERMKEQMEAESLSECTFTPRFNNNVNNSSLITTVNHANGGDISQRSKEWSKRIHERLEKERQDKELKKYEECTFQPSTSSNRASTPPPKNRISSPAKNRSSTPPPSATKKLIEKSNGNKSTILTAPTKKPVTQSSTTAQQPKKTELDKLTEQFGLNEYPSFSQEAATLLKELLAKHVFQ